MADYRMWSYWRNKYGYADALSCHYPKENDLPDIHHALFNIRSAEGLIDSVMYTLEYKERED